MKHIIFDFDGVLADTFDFHLKKANELFHVELTAQEYKDMHNGNFHKHTLKKMSGFKPLEYPNLVAKDQAKLPLDPKIKKLLEKLSKDYRLHIISSGWERQIVPFLKNHKIEHLFTELLFADHGKLKSGKFKKLFASQNTTSKNCLFVTDTLGDISESQEVNIPVIAVTFGFHDKEHLKSGLPTYLADSWSEVEKVIHNHF
jgi:phosphoglycolate phosphatase-like HAD superfamily hydrolase